MLTIADLTHLIISFPILDFHVFHIMNNSNKLTNTHHNFFFFFFFINPITKTYVQLYQFLVRIIDTDCRAERFTICSFLSEAVGKLR